MERISGGAVLCERKFVKIPCSPGEKFGENMGLYGKREVFMII